MVRIIRSLSSWRAWIEISPVYSIGLIYGGSLSSWRAWIEIATQGNIRNAVDSRSPHGERGLKS